MALVIGALLSCRVRSWRDGCTGCSVLFSSHSSLTSLRAQVRIINYQQQRVSAEYIQTIRIAMGKSIGSQSSQAERQDNLFQVHAECLCVLLSDKEEVKNKD